eukprot:TRINITY_DN187_c1_g1_i3.p1 TRINITY_DN187_c1_g1~~TRINITY_DN187_c1_g1_i3.p1  ORF type:complete len:278 (+),score=94.51 TRINITY_DN187_c1_g1_i3:72-905(+)
MRGKLDDVGLMSKTENWYIACAVLAVLILIAGVIMGLRYLVWFAVAIFVVSNAYFLARADHLARVSNDIVSGSPVTKGNVQTAAAGFALMTIGGWIAHIGLLPVQRAGELATAAPKLLTKPGSIAGVVTYAFAILSIILLWSLAGERQNGAGAGAGTRQAVLVAQILVNGCFVFGAALWGQHVPSAYSSVTGMGLIWFSWTLSEADTAVNPKEDLAKAAYTFVWLTGLLVLVTLALFGPDGQDSGAGGDRAVSPKAGAKKTAGEPQKKEDPPALDQK